MGRRERIAAYSLLVACVSAVFAGGQALEYRSHLRPVRPVVGESFVVEFEFPNIEEVPVRVVPANLPPALQYAIGPHLEWANRTLFVSYALIASRPGTHVIGGFVIRIGSDAIETRSLSVEVAAARAVARAAPTLSWHPEAESVYQHQPTPVSLRLQTNGALYVPTRIEPPAVPGATVVATSPSQPIQRIDSEARTGFDQNIGSYLVSAERAGQLILPETTVVLANGMRVTASARRLAVRPLPAGVLGVGDMTYQWSGARRGSSVEVRTSLNGSGSRITPPAPTIDGLAPHLVATAYELVPGPTGWVGSRILVATFSAPPEAAEGRLVLPAVPMIRPDGSRYRLGGLDIEVAALPHDPEPFAVGYDLRDDAALIDGAWCEYRSDDAGSHLAFAPGPIVLVFYLALRRRGRRGASPQRRARPRAACVKGCASRTASASRRLPGCASRWARRARRETPSSCTRSSRRASRCAASRRRRCAHACTLTPSRAPSRRRTASPTFVTACPSTAQRAAFGPRAARCARCCPSRAGGGSARM